jgi:hypothetical protein
VSHGDETPTIRNEINIPGQVSESMNPLKSHQKVGEKNICIFIGCSEIIVKHDSPSCSGCRKFNEQSNDPFHLHPSDSSLSDTLC